MKPITEDDIEYYAIEELERLGWTHLSGPDIGPGGSVEERGSYEEIVLRGRLMRALTRINPGLPAAVCEQALHKVVQIYSPDLLHNNEIFHGMLVEKVKVPYQQDGYERSHEVALIDWEHPDRNEFLVVNQYTIVEGNQNKRPDLLLFVNGIPLVILELKNAADENATLRKAFDQIQTYKATIPSLFTYNALCIISDGHDCKAGSMTAGFTRFMAWKSADGQSEASKLVPQLEVMISGMLQPTVLLDLVRNFVVFEKSRREDPKTGITQVITEKKVAAYHQYYAVNKAVQSTVRASSTTGDRRGGVVWHTQGSGKSLSMVFFAGKLITSAEMQNPTIVVITDRNDLDEQLFDTFAGSRSLLRQDPVQAASRDHLRDLLKVASGGIVFTTIQKFMPEEGKADYDQLSNRRNIVVIADEAHRTQYGFEAKLIDEKDTETKEVIGKRIAYGFAKYMRDALPNATYIGFTGTPIEGTDVNTAQVFGNYVDVYDISQAVADGATVRIYYESRLAKVNLDAEGRRLIEEFDAELELEEETDSRQKVKSKWTRLEAIVGNEERIRNLAQDIVTHFESRQSVFEGKGMVVAMSRRIAAELYKEIVALRPEWHDADLGKGAIKVVMTATSSDGPEMQRHHTTKQQRRALGERMRDPQDALKLVIVRDMWLTGFDAPCLHTLYIDKPMQGHNLMQAIARVNRVFKDKPGGLVVDYLGIGTDLKKALSFYAAAGGKGDPTERLSLAISALEEKLDVVRMMFWERPIKIESPSEHDDEYWGYGIAAANSVPFGNPVYIIFKSFFTGDAREKLRVILQAEEHILGLDRGKERYVREVSLLGQALALCISSDEAKPHLEEIAFLQAVKARLVKFDGGADGSGSLAMETAIKQIVDQALSSDRVIDVFDAAGIRKPDISILSEEFLKEVQGMQHRNLALELLKKVLNDEIKTRSKRNLVQSRALLEMLEGAIKRYQNNLLSTAEIIQELINLAKSIKDADARGEALGLSPAEVAFYDALETNDSAVAVLGDDVLREIARTIASKVRENTTIDWNVRESARAKLMVLVRRTLSMFGYPPDKQEKAVETVLRQAELMAGGLLG